MITVWNAYQPNFNPSDAIRRRTNPLYDVPLTNGQRAMFYRQTISDSNRNSYEFLFSERPVVAEYSSVTVYRG